MQLDYRNPDYAAIFAERTRRLKELRADPSVLETARAYYRNAPWDFISDWGMTFEPRNLEVGRLASIPFVLWPKQVEYVQWIHARWRARERGLVEKSRDCGVSWLSVGFAVAMWLFLPGFTAGLGSRKADLVDRSGDMDSLFEKLRFFVDNVPVEFLPKGFSESRDSAYMRLINNENEAAITGEAGDQIGRGGRKSIYIVDEAAFIEKQDNVDKALSQTTNCQIDVSTPNGSGNAFHNKRLRFEGTSRVFVFDWRDDPRKDDAWYARQLEELDEVAVAQEIDRSYEASQEDSFIPAKWVAAAIDAHVLLGFEPQGLRVTGFDPADVGDARAVCDRWGSVVLDAEEKTTGDITDAIPWAFQHADALRADALVYDAGGMGAPAIKLALTQRTVGRLKVLGYNAEAAVVDPQERYGEEGRGLKKRALETAAVHGGAARTNADTFADFKAQTWTWVRNRFERTYEAVTLARAGKIVKADPEQLISLSSECTNLRELQAELSRPKRLFTPNGKIRVESKPQMKKRGVRSPNLAEGVVMAYSLRSLEPAKRARPGFRGQGARDRRAGY